MKLTSILQIRRPGSLPAPSKAGHMTDITTDTCNYRCRWQKHVYTMTNAKQRGWKTKHCCTAQSDRCVHDVTSFSSPIGVTDETIMTLKQRTETELTIMFFLVNYFTCKVSSTCSLKTEIFWIWECVAGRAVRSSERLWCLHLQRQAVHNTVGED
jgi:hypothetical protein